METETVRNLPNPYILGKYGLFLTVFKNKHMNNIFPKVQLQTIVVDLHKGQWLKDALAAVGEELIPSNTLLDKTITGVGATSMELESPRHSIILEPTLPVIHDKAMNKPFLPVYKECKTKDIKAYLQNKRIAYKKLLSTPESFYKIKKACHELGMDMYQMFFCLFDECEKLTQDVDYRKKITKPMADFFQFQGKALVSATPLEVSDPRFEGFTRIKIKPDYDYKEDLRLIVTNNVDMSVRKWLLEDLQESPRIFIFMNTTDGINKVVEALDIKEQSKIFCSDASVEKLKKRGLDNVESLYQEPLGKYNFFTCRFYSALDIHVDVLPDVVLLTNLYEASHSMLDPFTESIQAQGRFRKKDEHGKRFKSLTHISNVHFWQAKGMEELEEEINRDLPVYWENYQNLKKRYDEEADLGKKQAIRKDIERCRFADFLNKNEKGEYEIDYFAIDNYYNSKQVESYYQNVQTLSEAYERCGYFNLTMGKPFYFPLGDEERVQLKQKELPFARRCKMIVDILDANRDHIPHDYLLLFKDIQDFDLIYEMYQELGKKVLEEKKYQRAEVKKELEKAKDEKKRFCPELLELIFDTFPLEKSIPQEEIRDKLAELYRRFGITKKVKLKTIEEYYEVSPSYDKKPYTYKLKAFKH